MEQLNAAGVTTATMTIDGGAGQDADAGAKDDVAAAGQAGSGNEADETPGASGAV